MNIIKFLIPKSLVLYVQSDCTIRQALERMKYHRYTAIPVLMPDGKYVGTLRNDDILKYFLDSGRFDSRIAEHQSVLSVLDTGYSQPLYHHASMEDLFDKVKEHNFVPVVDDRGCFIGIILRRDVMNYLLTFYEKAKKTESDN